MEPFLFFGFFVLMFGVVIALSVAHAKKVRETWAMFARAHNLQFTPGSFNRHTLTGVFQGCPCSVSTEVRGSGKSRTTYTIFAAPARVPPDLNVYQESALSFLTKALGVQDIRTGDSELDARFVIQGVDPRGITNLLTHPRVRHCMLSVGAGQPGLRIHAGRAVIEMRGVPGDVAVLQRCLGGAVAVAAALSEAMGGAAPQVVARAAFVPPPPVINAASTQRGAIELFSAVAGAVAGAAAPLSKQPQVIPDKKLRGARVESPDAPRKVISTGGGYGTPVAVPMPVQGKPPAELTAKRHEPPPQPEQFGAWGTESPAPVLPWSRAQAEGSKAEGPTPAKPEPQAAPIPPAATPAPGKAEGSLEDTVKRLAAPGVPSTEREQLIAAITGKPCAFVGTVERVDWTSDLSLPDTMRSGRTAICKYAGATIAARFPESRNAAIDALNTGAALQVLGTVAGWDDFYGRLIVNVN